MNQHLITLIIALVIGYTGGYIANLNHSNSSIGSHSTEQTVDTQNPFQTFSDADDVAYQIEALQFQVETLQTQISQIQNIQEKTQANNQHASKNSPNQSKQKNTRYQVTPNQQNLIASGISPDIAEELLRRISQQDYRRLELQNLMQRSNPNQRRQYAKELRELNKNKISMRSEMGDEAYDQYLFVSGQNNRVKVSSVMAGSPAETSGFQTDDVILFYDNQKILGWSDIRKATIQGEIGSYTSVEILREGAQMSLMVPRGTLGVQLDAMQVDPTL